MPNVMNRAIRRLLQRNAALGATGVTFFLLACGSVCADGPTIISTAQSDADPSLTLLEGCLIRQ